MSSCAEIAVIAVISAGCLWCILGDIAAFRTVFAYEAAYLFELEDDGQWRLHRHEIPGSRFRRWDDAFKDMLARGLAVQEKDGSLVLTKSGAAMRQSLKDFEI